MNNISILQISNIIENSLKETIKTIRNISRKYKDEISALPFEIDILGEALHSKTLYETAHCRILYRLLQNKDVQESFIRYFLPNVDYSRGSIQIPYPESVLFRRLREIFRSLREFSPLPEWVRPYQLLRRRTFHPSG